MLLNEDKEFKEIIASYEKAIALFRKKDFPKAKKQFEELLAAFSGSEYFSVLEVVGKARDYLSLCDLQLNPSQVDLKNDEEIIQEAVYQINSSAYDKALELLSRIKSPDATTHYLTALIRNKQDKTDESLESLSKCILKDPTFKVLIYNEPDFNNLKENEKFQTLIQ